MADYTRRIISVEETYDDSRIDEWTPDEQVTDCCQEIPDADPCTDEGKVEVWNGYPQSEDDWDPEKIMADWEWRVGGRILSYVIDNVEGPVSGGPCGEQRTTWEGSLGCCDIEYPMTWGVTTSPYTVERDKYYTFTVGGGTLPYSFSVVGYGAIIVGGDSVSTKLLIDVCMCNPILLIATDACNQQIIKILSLDDGSWASATDAYYLSDYGWMHDGHNVARCTGGARSVYGFNSDRTIYSQQLFGQVCYTKATPAEPDETAIAGICAAGIAQGDYAASGAVSAPGNAEGYTKCDSGNVWYKDVTDDPNYSADFHAYYQNTSGSTYEYTPGTCEDELEYDWDNSIGVAINDYSYGRVEWTGGIPPFDVSLDGVEVFLDSDRTTNQLRTTGRGATVYTGNTCGTTTVTITDSCGVSVEGSFIAADGYWQQQEPSWTYPSWVFPDYITPGPGDTAWYPTGGTYLHLAEVTLGGDKLRENVFFDNHGVTTNCAGCLADHENFDDITWDAGSCRVPGEPNITWPDPYPSWGGGGEWPCVGYNEVYSKELCACLFSRDYYRWIC